MATTHPGVTGRATKKQLEPLAVSPRQTSILIDCGLTRVYDLINRGELESYLDGRSRKVTMRSIRDHQERLLAAARTAGSAIDVMPQITELFAHKKLRIHDDILFLFGKIDQRHPDLSYHEFYRALVLLHTTMDVEGYK
jgi:hypothetical protein